ncbi:uncharacterized protein TNCT_159571 [Trichonephila clavata]|uniref:Uncharacterized protein n=1 Tax=Trichonephila clavata TaxID=2740835 RepID=A0A8X6GNS9_TRICU|nr:uncharacterized protein TNCT_159571 [Trichonephila clavata]
MECTITSYSPDPPPVSRMKYMKADTTKTVLHVNFEPEKGEVQERKKKYLTAKYGQHQMNLIRKRLRVEMWMFDQLQALYGHRVRFCFLLVFFVQQKVHPTILNNKVIL